MNAQSRRKEGGGTKKSYINRKINENEDYHTIWRCVIKFNERQYCSKGWGQFSKRKREETEQRKISMRICG